MRGPASGRRDRPSTSLHDDSRTEEDGHRHRWCKAVRRRTRTLRPCRRPGAVLDVEVAAGVGVGQPQPPQPESALDGARTCASPSPVSVPKSGTRRTSTSPGWTMTLPIVRYAVLSDVSWSYSPDQGEAHDVVDVARTRWSRATHGARADVGVPEAEVVARSRGRRPPVRTALGERGPRAAARGERGTRPSPTTERTRPCRRSAGRTTHELVGSAREVDAREQSRRPPGPRSAERRIGVEAALVRGPGDGRGEVAHDGR